MTEVEVTYENFIASRRSGRRNAIHDIPAGPTQQGGTGLSQSLAQLNISKSGDEAGESERSEDSPSKEQESRAECS